jgi:hypothetical protein
MDCNFGLAMLNFLVEFLYMAMRSVFHLPHTGFIGWTRAVVLRYTVTVCLEDDGNIKFRTSEHKATKQSA